MPFCLPKEASKKLLEALRTGKITPDDIGPLVSSTDRRAFLEKIVGPDHIHELNAMLESKLILKDWQRGMVSAIKQVSGLKDPTRRDLVAKVERMTQILSPEDTKLFLEDLVAKKLGTEVTLEEAQNTLKMAKDVEAKRALIPDNSPDGSKERLDYGTRLVLFREYMDELKGNKGVLHMPFKDWIKSPTAIIETLAGTVKSIVASLDNSFVGRQGLKMLFTHPSIWLNTFMKTWSDIGKELGGVDAMLAVKADIVSRANAMNGKYEAGKYDVGIKTEEAFPTSLPAKIPILGRLYKASESAFSGAALRMRADYADLMIKKAEAFGVDTLNKEEAVGIGRLVNSMTGRGSVPLTEGQAKAVNVLFFSAKFLKSNIDTLTAHIFDAKVRQNKFARREAAMNLLKIAGGISVLLWTANQLQPGSVDFDPRSSDFGKIKIGDTRFDVSGGMSSLVVLASRLIPTMHNGKLGFYSKSSTSGAYTDLLAGKYGQQTPLDVFDNFWQGKLSPMAGAVRDLWKGQDFSGRKPTAITTALNLTTPLSIQTYLELKNNPKSADLLASMIADGLGISVNTYSPPKKKH